MGLDRQFTSLIISIISALTSAIITKAHMVTHSRAAELITTFLVTLLLSLIA